MQEGGVLHEEAKKEEDPELEHESREKRVHSKSHSIYKTNRQSGATDAETDNSRQNRYIRIEAIATTAVCSSESCEQLFMPYTNLLK